MGESLIARFVPLSPEACPPTCILHSSPECPEDEGAGQRARDEQLEHVAPCSRVNVRVSGATEHADRCECHQAYDDPEASVSHDRSSSRSRLPCALSYVRRPRGSRRLSSGMVLPGHPWGILLLPIDATRRPWRVPMWSRATLHGAQIGFLGTHDPGFLRRRARAGPLRHRRRRSLSVRDL